MITGSALPRLLNCPASAVLEKAETASRWAESGTDEHEHLADLTRRGELPPELARYVPEEPYVEVKLAYDVASRDGRLLGTASDRSYGTGGPFTLFMTADFLGVDGDAVIVGDWKTGHDSVEPAATNGQLWAGALAACRALGRNRAIVRIVYTNQGSRCDEHEIDALDLAEFADKLERLHVEIARLKAAKTRGEILSTKEGSWCQHCASKHVCPSKTALLNQLAGDELVVIGETRITSERAAAAYGQLVRIEQLTREARARLTTYIDENGPIDLGNGKMFGRYVRKGVEVLDGDVAVKAIRQVASEHADEFEAIAVERMTSKAAIERAAKDLGCKRGTAPAVIRRIRELGGASHKAESLPVGEYVRGKDEPAGRPTIDTDAVNRLLESA